MTYSVDVSILPRAGTQINMYYTQDDGSIGSRGQLLIVNHGNALVNRGNLTADFYRDTDYVRVAISNSVVTSPENFIMYDTPVTAGHQVQLQELCFELGENLFVYSQKGQVSFTFNGRTY
jgi:hypothetical protein